MVASGQSNADDESLAGIRAKAAANSLRVTQHAQQEMVEDAFVLDDVLHALSNATVIEDYPDHRRGACCLVSGSAPDQRPIHIVCTTTSAVLIIITVYEPKPPKWVTPTQRGRQP
jgi:hypothetical protein